MTPDWAKLLKVFKTVSLAMRCCKASHQGLYTASPLRAFESELGVQDPVGFFDPLGFTSDGSAENFKRRRQTELKHGRISMLATMGYITPEITGKFPGYLSPSAGLKFADIPNGLGAISKVPPLGWAQIFAYGGFCELSQDQSAGTPASEGDFGFKVLTSSDPEEKKKKLAAELANGRLAMMAIIGMFFQDGLTGSSMKKIWRHRKTLASHIHVEEDMSELLFELKFHITHIAASSLDSRVCSSKPQSSYTP